MRWNQAKCYLLVFDFIGVLVNVSQIKFLCSSFWNFKFQWINSQCYKYCCNPQVKFIHQFMGSRKFPVWWSHQEFPPGVWSCWRQTSRHSWCNSTGVGLLTLVQREWYPNLLRALSTRLSVQVLCFCHLRSVRRMESAVSGTALEQLYGLWFCLQHSF